jgi:hypothetical protein
MNNHLLHWSTEHKQSPLTLNPRNTNNHLLHWTHWTQITVMVSHQYQQHEQSPLTLNHWTRTITSYIEPTEHEQSPLTLIHWTRTITSYIEPTEHEQSPLTLNPLNTNYSDGQPPISTTRPITSDNHPLHTKKQWWPATNTNTSKRWFFVFSGSM